MSKRKMLLWLMAAVAGTGSFAAVAIAYELLSGATLSIDHAEALRTTLLLVPLVWVPTLLLGREYERAANDARMLAGASTGGISWQDMRRMTMHAPLVVRLAWGAFIVAGLALVIGNLDGRTSLGTWRVLSQPEALFLAGLEMLLLSTAFLDLLSAAMMRGDYRQSIAIDDAQAGRRWLTARRPPVHLAGWGQS